MRPDSDDRAGCDLPAGRYEPHCCQRRRYPPGEHLSCSMATTLCLKPAQIPEKLPKRWNAFYLQEVRKRGCRKRQILSAFAHAEPALSRH